MYNTKSCAKLGIFFGAFFLSIIVGMAQTTNEYEGKAKFEDNVNSYLSMTTPIINAQHLNKIYDDVVVLDIREREEYDVSHLPGAIYFGSKKPNYNVLDDFDKDQKFVVYCSIGYRSEKMGQKIIKRGYKNVYNLYGSIFAWVNENNPVHDITEQETQKVHTYNRRWSKWVMNTKYKKVY